MKKVLLISIMISISALAYAQNNDVSQYAKELDCEYPYRYNVSSYLESADELIDLEKYKTIIRNGDISAIEKPYLNDLQLGALSKTELKLFRNLFYAKKGYIFSDKELEKFFMQFDWYKPKSKDVSFTWLEESAINRIKLFENESTVKYDFENRSIIWETWNGGADQRGPLLKLNKDKTFEYIPGKTINRVEKINGSWLVLNNKIILSVENETVVFGGYVTEDASYIKNGTSVIIQYKSPVKISLPLNESQAPQKYNLKWGEKWLMIGSGDCYISNE